MASQGAHPACLFLTLTLVVTAGATVILLTAILTNHWEEISYDRKHVETITAARNQTHFLSWLIGGRVAQIDILLLPPSHIDNKEKKIRSMGQPRKSAKTSITTRTVFLVPLNGGIWTLCLSLTEKEQTFLTNLGMKQKGCINYLSQEFYDAKNKNEWVERMQNLSISCSLVCCILLGASAIVGTVGIIHRQISAVLITGVMYILATTFGLFCLSIMHFKRRTQKDCGILDSQIASEYIVSRSFSTGWSLELGWVGAVACLCSALLWLLLAKVMRYNPISLS